MRTPRLLIALTALLAGCASLPGTPGELIKSPGHVAEAAFTAPLDVVYRKATEQMSACAARLGPQARVVSDKASDGAQITLLSSTVIAGNAVYVVLKLTHAANGTKVVQYSPRAGLPTIPAATLSGWIERDEKECF